MPVTDKLLPTFSGIALALLLSACSAVEVQDPLAPQPASRQPAGDPAKERGHRPRPDDDATLIAQAMAVDAAAPADDSDSEAAPDDLWERVRGGFRLSIPTQQPRLDQETHWYATHPDYLARIQERAAPYLHYIMEQVEARDLPAELALLPVVESAYQPFAYSPGRAAGLWQFIPSTGRMYGLKQNWWYDGRRDPVASTEAALDYLQSLVDQFDGDWELALAAYNSGAGTVRRAIRRNEKKGRPTDFWSLDLPKETEGYVPRLLAITRVFSNPEKFGVSLTPIPNQPYFETVDIEAQIDLALAAEMAEISIEELYRLNSGFNRWATDPQGPHRLSLPLDSVSRFSERLLQTPPQQRLQWQRYKVRNGDVLGGIAKRHGTSVAVLKQVNGLKSDRIRAGKHLLIPLASKDLAHYSLSAQQRRSKLQNAQRSGNKHTHRVRRGDTLWDIARSYKVGHKQLARWNGISPRDTLSPGQTLVIWSRAGKNAQIAETITVPDTGPLFDSQSTVRYRVRKGDSLSHIAQRFNVSVSDLKKWNKLPGKYLQPGQRLKLYVDVTQQTL